MQQCLDLVTHDPRRHDDTVRGAHHRLGSRLRVLSTLLSVAVVVLACGGGSTSVVGSTTKHKPTPTPTPTPTSGPNSPIDVTVDGIHIQSGPLACMPSVFYGEGTPLVVLATTRLAYDAGEVNQMHDYFDSMQSTMPNTLPDTLRKVDGATTTPQIGKWIGGGTPLYCVVGLNITNNGTSPIQIPEAGLQLQAAPQPNPVQYHLVDQCSLNVPASPRGCQGGEGAATTCLMYQAQVQLARGATGAEYLASPVGKSENGDSCPALILSPGASTDLTLNFGSAEALAYRGAIELKLVTGATQQTLVLSQAPSTLTFADSSQFTCYSLQGSTFTAEFQGTAALQGLIYDPQTGLPQDCI